jgi:glycosyltransferase involved in cell wall biosynthesis
MIPLLQELDATLNEFDFESEVVIVDDGSTDGCWNQLQKLQCSFPFFCALRLSRNFGKESAIAAGLNAATGNAVVVMDGDLQHPPKMILQMVDCWKNGADVVEAVKIEQSGRRWGAKIFNKVFCRLTGYDLRGATDFKLMDRIVLDAWKQMPEYHLFFRGMNAWLGFKRVRLSFEVPNRKCGETRWSTLQLSRLAANAITAFSTMPLHMITLIGAMFGILSLVLGFQTLYLKFSGQAVDGFTTVILLILLTGGVLMLGLGMIGVYISRIYDELKRRPRYIVREHLSRRET